MGKFYLRKIITRYSHNNGLYDQPHAVIYFNDIFPH